MGSCSADTVLGTEDAETSFLFPGNAIKFQILGELPITASATHSSLCVVCCDIRRKSRSPEGRENLCKVEASVINGDWQGEQPEPLSGVGRGLYGFPSRRGAQWGRGWWEHSIYQGSPTYLIPRERGLGASDCWGGFWVLTGFIFIQAPDPVQGQKFLPEAQDGLRESLIASWNNFFSIRRN